VVTQLVAVACIIITVVVVVVFIVRNNNGCVSFRKVVKSQERLGRAIQEVSSLK